MQGDKLQNLLSNLHIANLPYAFWSLPSSKSWKGIAQKDRQFDNFSSFLSEGFICKSFDNSQNIRLIRPDLHFDKSNLDLKIKVKTIEGDARETIELFETTKVNYLDQCATIVDNIKKENAEKVVLSRLKKVVFNGEIPHLFLNLVNAYPNAMLFLYEFVGNVWIGASP
jgi:isochorismate synthase EntC